MPEPQLSDSNKSSTGAGLGAPRAHWRSRLGFVLAAAGSAIGLGNIWKFPYITGENGGGLFVLIYLGCVALVAMPIMMAEVVLGRATQRSPVGAFSALAGKRSPWVAVGWLGVASAFVILSYYSVVAGWALHYTWLSLVGGLPTQAEAVRSAFAAVYASPATNLLWHFIFMGLTVMVVIGGVRGGIERASRYLMPALFLMLLALLIRAATTSGFWPALSFVFGAHSEKLSAGGVLEALGHSFFTLSLGMGAMLTYGSYLDKKDDLVSASLITGVLDTLVALLACMVLFPIIFTFGMEPAAGPGLVFVSVPIALAQLPGGTALAAVFFLLLVFAALTSAISLLEVAATYFIDERGWSRPKATLLTGGLIALFGVPSALSGGTALFGARIQALTGKNWFDTFDYLASNWMLPLGGLFIALFAAFRVSSEVRKNEFLSGSRFGALYRGWLILLRYLVPLGVVAVFLHAIGIV